jgi:hypothetical protein
VAFEHVLGRVHMEHDAEHTRAEAIRQDYVARTHDFTASCRRSFSFDQILEERRTLLSVQDINLERREEKLMEEQAHGLRSFDGRELSVGLEELHLRLAMIEDERVTEAVRLSQLVIEISDAQVDLGVLPIREIPRLPKSA